MSVKALNQAKVASVFNHCCSLVLPLTCLLILSNLTLATTSNDSMLCLTKTSLKEGNLVQELKEPHWQQDMKGGVALALHLTRWSTF